MTRVQNEPDILAVSVERTGNFALVALDGELDLSNAATLATELTGLVDDHSRVTIDLARLSFLDSSGIRCFMATAQRASERGCDLVVERATDKILRVLEVAGVEELLNHSNGDGAKGR